ncbi:hypothetical protein [Promicromonospora sp. NPDC019610]|uniref:hypothetical protein n=1 Tax=Promicromonospora sp. NPDC019610 TaxID=3364405 RepID=UPI0037A9801D
MLVPTALLAAVLLPAVLTSCSAGPDDAPAGPVEPAPAREAATEQYTAALDDVLGALQESVPGVAWTAKDRFPFVTGQPDGECVLFLAESLGEGDLYEPSDGLADLAAGLDPVLREHGFDPLSDVTHADNGGDAYVTATDPAGWELRVSAYPPLVGLSGPVESDECVGA